jgi:hypothetical protein
LKGKISRGDPGPKAQDEFIASAGQRAQLDPSGVSIHVAISSLLEAMIAGRAAETS